MAGWWKFQREWLDDPTINKDADYLRLWVYLNNMAAYSESRRVEWKGQVITLRAGQLTAGRNQLAELTGINPYKVYRILRKLESAQLIAQQHSPQTSLITILTGFEDNESAQQAAQQVHNGCTTSAQQVHTNKERKKEIRRELLLFPADNEKEERRRALDAFLEDAERRAANEE